MNDIDEICSEIEQEVAMLKIEEVDKLLKDDTLYINCNAVAQIDNDGESDELEVEVRKGEEVLFVENVGYDETMKCCFLLVENEDGQRFFVPHNAVRRKRYLS